MENTNEDFTSKLLLDLESDRIERTVSTNETEEKRLIEKRASFARTFDALPCFEAKIEDLNLSTFLQDYLPTAIDADTLRENNRHITQKLSSLRMYDLRYDCPTNAGILCFAVTTQVAQFCF